MSVLSSLDNQIIWRNFESINAIPRASKKEDRIVEFMIDFGKSLGLETIKDKIGNVIIKKPATEDRKGAPTLILQSHLDMVHQKNNDTQFDFNTEGIKMKIEGDWIKAEGTTLGADNGIGVAAIMGILKSKDISHPNIEALFTIDEETGMTGAKGLEEGILDGKILLNLDTEEDHHLDIGCAGGVDITAESTYVPQASDLPFCYKLEVKGLSGGHSGMEIHKGLGNSNKIMNRILFYIHEKINIEIVSVEGGGLRNAIPRESVAIVRSDKNIQLVFEDIVLQIHNEYKSIEPNLSILCSSMVSDEKVMPIEEQERFLKVMYAAHNGVYRMSVDFENLVETSNNIARVEVKNGSICIKCLTRSSVESSKVDLVNQLSATFSLMGAKVQLSGDYPGWSPNPNSSILQTMKQIYIEMFNSNPEVVACHAGLECGIIAGHYPGLDMISFGPTILGAHSPDERVSISSVDKFWKLLCQTLKTI